ncbi:hypothetical protein BTUL_0042g00470 [Botrytis tulipae]|uniref:Uncharacterized protein n=1 Tax=Botrytis tulipae TaxID=87230 RepID=A0A4Z1ESQ0_9HELO|nr:hypothetical protein BTUL_0042g00470 [Botrytis tulipae]
MADMLKDMQIVRQKTHLQKMQRLHKKPGYQRQQQDVCKRYALLLPQQLSHSNIKNIYDPDDGILRNGALSLLKLRLAGAEAVSVACLIPSWLELLPAFPRAPST